LPEDPPKDGSPATSGSTGLRALFYIVWIITLPFVLAILAVWLLTPAPGDHNAGGLRVFVAEQQIPAGIVLFTLFAMAMWHFRFELPLSGALGVGRKDIPATMRARFEEAQVLIEETLVFEPKRAQALKRHGLRHQAVWGGHNGQERGRGTLD